MPPYRIIPSNEEPNTLSADREIFLAQNFQASL